MVAETNVVEIVTLANLDTTICNSEPKLKEIENEETTPETEMKKNKTLLYEVDEIPPIHYTFFLGLQQYLTMFCGSMSIPYILAPAMCISEDSPVKAILVSTLLFASGIVTFVQTTFGIRLPIIQGGSFAFLVPTLTILSLPKWKCPDKGDISLNGNVTEESMLNDDEIWMLRMREIQGAICIAALFHVVIGVTGAVGVLIRWITPLTIAPTVTLVGLSLFSEAAEVASKQWGLAFGTTILLLLFSQYLEKVPLPFPVYKKGVGLEFIKVPVFTMFPVLLALLFMWAISAILTATDVLPHGTPGRTDYNLRILHDSPWVRVPYPGQWGLPTVSAAAVVGMLAGAFATSIESIGNFYACARLSGARAPPPHAVNRGILCEGLGCITAGLLGTGNGTTSYSENVAIIGITKVASRRVVQMAAVLMVLLAVFTKFGAVFVSIPSPILGGIFLVTFGMIVAVGISNVQYINLNSPRNLCILGFSLFTGIAIPKWLVAHKGIIQTGSTVADQVFTVILSSSMLLGGIFGFVLDNTVPGSLEDRGIIKWREQAAIVEGQQQDPTYDLPFGKFLRRFKFLKYVPVCPSYQK